MVHIDNVRALSLCRDVLLELASGAISSYHIEGF
jgi:hypothetical protein